jgi:hypothetical protein
VIGSHHFVQVWPSPEYPGLQVQVKLPGVFLQVALALQFAVPAAHSSTSTQPEEVLQL